MLKKMSVELLTTSYLVKLREMVLLFLFLTCYKLYLCTLNETLLLNLLNYFVEFSAFENKLYLVKVVSCLLVFFLIFIFLIFFEKIRICVFPQWYIKKEEDFYLHVIQYGLLFWVFLGFVIWFISVYCFSIFSVFSIYTFLLGIPLYFLKEGKLRVWVDYLHKRCVKSSILPTWIFARLIGYVGLLVNIMLWLGETRTTSLLAVGIFAVIENLGIHRFPISAEFVEINRSLAELVATKVPVYEKVKWNFLQQIKESNFNKTQVKSQKFLNHFAGNLKMFKELVWKDLTIQALVEKREFTYKLSAKPGKAGFLYALDLPVKADVITEINNINLSEESKILKNWTLCSKEAIVELLPFENDIKEKLLDKDNPFCGQRAGVELFSEGFLVRRSVVEELGESLQKGGLSFQMSNDLVLGLCANICFFDPLVDGKLVQAYARDPRLVFDDIHEGISLGIYDNYKANLNKILEKGKPLNYLSMENISKALIENRSISVFLKEIFIDPKIYETIVEIKRYSVGDFRIFFKDGTSWSVELKHKQYKDLYYSSTSGSELDDDITDFKNKLPLGKQTEAFFLNVSLDQKKVAYLKKM